MSVNTKSMINVINENKQKKISASKIIESNSADLPILGKLVSDKQRTGSLEDGDYLGINRGILENIHNRIAGSINNNKNIIQLFPENELIIQILVSSILSPKKMTDVQLNYRLNKKVELNPEVSSEILDSIKSYVEENYKIEEELPDILREALFTSGACAYSVIPEAAIDNVINADLFPSYGMEEYKNRVDVVLESFTAPRNLLSQVNNKSKALKPKASLEELAEHLIGDNLVRLTDNLDILNYNSIKESISSKIIKDSARRGTTISTESIEKVKYLDIFRDRGTAPGNREVEYLKNRLETSRKSIGKPMVTKFPTESVIPVFVPGNERNHVAYFVLLDETGKPLSANINDTDINRLNSNLHDSKGAQTNVQKAYRNLVSSTDRSTDIEGLFQTYRSVLEKQLFSTVKSSLYGKSVEVAEKNDIYFLMFTRALQEQRTTLLFVPKEQMVYFAFQYNETGTGKSLLDNLAVQSSLRAILLFSKVMALAKQSIDVTKVNIGLDPNDPDPEKTIEQVQASVLKLRQNFLPLGINNPVDLVNWIQKAGLQFTYENNPRLPDVNIDFENSNMNHTLPESDLEEELRKQSIIALGLPPEIVDNAFSPEFAKTVVNNNVLLSKRVSLYQSKLEKDLTKFNNLIINTDEDLRKILKEIISGKKGIVEQGLEEEEKALLNKNLESFLDYYVDKLSDSITIELPRPEDTDLRNLSEEYDLYKEAVEKTLESVVSSEIFSEDVSGDMSAHIDTLKNVYLHHLLRKWMADNNFLPEVLEISGTDVEDVDAIIRSLSSHLASTMRNNTKLMSVMKKFKAAINKDLEDAFNNEEPEGGEAGESSTSEDTSEEDSGTDPFDEDFNLDL